MIRLLYKRKPLKNYILILFKLIGSISSGIPDLGEAHRKHFLKQLKNHA